MIKNKRGQAVFESVLLLALILFVWIGLTTSLRKMEFFQNVFGTTWSRLANTMEFGIPVAQRGQASSHHPTSFDRHSSVLHEE